MVNYNPLPRPKRDPDKLTLAQQKMLKALVKTMGNVTKSCEMTGINRRSHYEWLREVPAYRAEYDFVNDVEADFLIEAFKKLVAEGNPAAIIFGLKTKAKHRGYVERHEFVHHNRTNNSITVEVVRRSPDTVHHIDVKDLPRIDTSVISTETEEVREDTNNNRL
jgi:hypothetical protein